MERLHDKSKFYYSDEESFKENVTNVGRGKVSPLENNGKQIQQFIEEQRGVSKTKKTNYDLNVWHRFCQSLKEERKLENMPAVELKVLLRNFVINIIKKNGDVYKPSLLPLFHNAKN